MNFDKLNDKILSFSAQRGDWQLTPQMTDKQIISGGQKYLRHKTTHLWWSKDTAGHGGSTFKVYKEKFPGKLEWFRDADQYGDFIDPKLKHKSPKGKQVLYDIIGEKKT